MSSSNQNNLIMPTAQEAEEARALLSNLNDEHIHIQTSNGVTFSLSTTAITGLKNLLLQIAQGNAISITPVRTELTTHQAAELLNVSRPYLIKLLEQGHIPYRKVGSHRRIPTQPLLEYKAREEEKANSALDEIVSLTEKLGLYD